MTSKTKRILGIGLLVAPILGLVMTLSFYAISSFVISAVVMSGAGEVSNEVPLFASALRVGLGIMGIVCALGILVGPFLGGYLLYTAGDDGSFKPKHRRIDELALMFLFTAGLSVLIRVSDLFVKVPVMKTFDDIGLFLASLSWTTISLTIAGLLAHLSATVIFLYWLGRSANNLKLASKNQPKIDPFFLVWGNLIPVYNIFHSIIAFPDFWKDVVEHYHSAKADFLKVLWAIRVFFIVDMITLALSFVAEDTGAWLGLDEAQTMQAENYLTFGFYVISMGALMYFVHTVTKHMKSK